MHEYNFYKLPPEILRGTTRIQVFVVQDIVPDELRTQ